MSSEIQLEAFIDEQGRLLARCKDSKRVVAGLQSVSLSNDISEPELRYVSIDFAEFNDET